jgi:hypothetical protein
LRSAKAQADLVGNCVLNASLLPISNALLEKCFSDAGFQNFGTSHFEERFPKSLKVALDPYLVKNLFEVPRNKNRTLPGRTK